MIAQLLSNFRSISLSEMNDVALMKRVDTKYILTSSQVAHVLQQLVNDYRILDIKGKRLMQYSTLYFDTEENRFYQDHHNQKATRKKIRMRKYVDSDLSFLEVKKRNNKNVTEKSRIKIEDIEEQLSDEANDFLQKNMATVPALKPNLFSKFKRLTLVNKEQKERVTIDTDLRYEANDEELSIPNIAIVEVKQEGINRSTKIRQVLKSQNIRVSSISKYCLGITNLYKEIKQNRFKPLNLKIKKLSK